VSLRSGRRGKTRVAKKQGRRGTKEESLLGKGNSAHLLTGKPRLGAGFLERVLQEFHQQVERSQGCLTEGTSSASPLKNRTSRPVEKKKGDRGRPEPPYKRRESLSKSRKPEGLGGGADFCPRKGKGDFAARRDPRRGNLGKD